MQLVDLSSDDEIKESVSGLSVDSAPGPNGFGAISIILVGKLFPLMLFSLFPFSFARLISRGA